MKLSWDDILANAVAFAKKWKDAKNEELETSKGIRRTPRWRHRAEPRSQDILY